MFLLDHLWIILALPLVGAALNGLLGKNWSKTVVNSVAVGSVSLAFLSVAEVVREFFQLGAGPNSLRRQLFHLDDGREPSALTFRCKSTSLLS